MAVQYVDGRGGGGFLGGLGGVLTLASAMIPGAPLWLGPLGAGLGAAGSAARGDIGGAATGLAGAFKQMSDAGGFENMFKKKPAPYQPNEQDMMSLWKPRGMY